MDSRRRFTIEGDKDSKVTDEIAAKQHQNQIDEAVEAIKKCHSFSLIFQNENNGGAICAINGPKAAMILSLACGKMAKDIADSVISHIKKML